MQMEGSCGLDGWFVNGIGRLVSWSMDVVVVQNCQFSVQRPCAGERWDWPEPSILEACFPGKSSLAFDGPGATVEQGLWLAASRTTDADNRFNGAQRSLERHSDWGRCSRSAAAMDGKQLQSGSKQQQEQRQQQVSDSQQQAAKQQHGSME